MKLPLALILFTALFALGLYLGNPALIFIGGAFFLVESSEWVIENSIKLSRLWGISTFTIGFILISVSTSLPELSVAIFSSLRNVPALSVGTVLGSNLTDLTLILGICAIIGSQIVVKKKEFRGLIELLFITSIVTVLIFFTSSLTIGHGIVLLALFAFLLLRLYNRGKISKKVFDGAAKAKGWRAGLKLIASIALLLFAAHFVVESAIDIAEIMAVPTAVIGATAVALSTSLPELTVELKAIKKKEYALAMGDLFGSAVTNITLVLGVTSLLNPGEINISSLVSVVPFLLITTFAIWYLFTKKGKISKREGLVLVAIYFLYLLAEFGILPIFG